ncbi:hypothetical protein WP50_29265 [Lactiplantibacillus plantarum]|nr:hypothetical protein WP50_29265 [Lactiplantibacillus plantarum]
MVRLLGQESSSSNHQSFQGTATRLALNDLPDLLTAKGGLNQSEWAQLTQLMTKLMTNLTR